MGINNRLAPQRSEKDILEFWRSNDINGDVSESRKGGRNLYLPRPPVSTKDILTWDELYANIIYDTISRFESMRTFNVRNGIGFDQFNPRAKSVILNEQADVSNLGSLTRERKEELIDLLEENSNKFLEKTKDELKEIGTWMIDDFYYHADSEEFIDAVWWALSELNEEGHLLEKERPMSWCPKCKFSPSVSEKSSTKESREEALVKVPLTSGKNRYFLTYLEDVWKYPASLYLLVHPEEDYAIVKSKMADGDFEQYVCLKDNVEEILSSTGIRGHEIQKVIGGKELEGLSYRQPLGAKIKEKKEIYGDTGKIVLSDKVSLDNTGIEPLVPPFDNIHWNIAEEKDLDVYNPLMMNGHHGGRPEKNKYSGLSAFQSEPVILNDLESMGLVLERFDVEEYLKRCETCRNRLITYPKQGWVFDASRIEKRSEEMVEDLELFPPDKEITFKEWNISRDDFWGHPLPIWECECGNVSVISDRSEFGEDIDDTIRADDMFDLEQECPECGEKMSWINRSIDPSFICSCAPWAQIGSPDKEKEYQSWWPGDIFIGDDDGELSLLDESVAISSSLFDKPSSEKLMALGDVVCEVDYDEVKSLVSSHGYDSLRVRLYSGKPPWESRELTAEDFEYMHPLIRVIKNIERFFDENLGSSEIELDEIKDVSLDDDISAEDEWILSRMGTVRKNIEESYSDHRFDEAVEVLSGFVLDDLAQSYIITARKRFDEGTPKQRFIVLKTLHMILNQISKIILPIAPFLAEDIYRSIEGQKVSVFMEEWPEDEPDRYNEILEDQMEDVKEIIDEIISFKRGSDLPEKWPLSDIVYKAKDPQAVEIIENFGRVIKEKAKIEEIETLYPDEDWDKAILTAEPKKDVIRKSYQHWVSKIYTMLKKKSPENLKEGMEKGGLEMGLEGQIVEIDPEMVDFRKEMPEDYEKISLDEQDIFIDLSVTDEIWDRETAKEIKLRIKSMRLDLELDERDEIDVCISADEEITDAVDEHRDELIEDTGVRDLVLRNDEFSGSQYILEWDVNGRDVVIGIDPLYRTEVIEYISDMSEFDEEIGQRFYESGYTSLDSIRSASPLDLSEVEGVDKEAAERIISSFEEEIEEDIEEKMDEETGEDVEAESVEEKPKEDEEEAEKEEIEEKKTLPDEITKSSTYLIKEEDSDMSFDLFKKILETDEIGLCVTRDYPDKIKEKYDLEEVDMIWLSNVDREDVIRPKSLEKLSLALENFLAKSGGVILFNGLEYLITNNDFRTVLHLVQSIKDQVAINRSILIIPVNPTILEENQLDQINGVVDEVIDNPD